MTEQSKQDHQNRTRWWITLCVKPALFLAAGVSLIVILGVAQKLGWISAGGSAHGGASGGGESVRYICPMM